MSDLPDAQVQRLRAARVEAYVSAVRRVRWWVLTTTLVCTLLITHLSLEQFGFTEHQLAGVFRHRFLHSATVKNRVSGSPCTPTPDTEFAKALCAELGCQSPPPKDVLDDMAAYFGDALGPTNRRDFEERLDEWSAQQFLKRRTSNLIDSWKPENHVVPLLGLSVPANDYVIVMSIFLCVLTVGLWINSRSLLGTIAAESSPAAANDSEFLETVRLNYVFFSGSPLSLQDRMASVVQASALLLPIATMGYVLVLDLMIPLLSGVSGHLGTAGAIVWRISLLVLLTVIIGMVSVATFVAAHGVDKRRTASGSSSALVPTVPTPERGAP